MIGTSLTITIVVSLSMDVLLVRDGTSASFIFVAAVLFNATTMLQTLTGAVIEWRRPGHLIGRLLMISGPLYALLGASWLTSPFAVKPLLDPITYQHYLTLGGALSWPGVALIAGWIPLLYPSGSLPGPRWRLPALAIAGIGTAGVVASVVKPDGQPGFLQLLGGAAPIALVALFSLAVAGLVTRYRRGDPVERLQVRWLLAAVSVVVAGMVGLLIETALRPDDGPLLLAVVYVGILLMPIAMGIAILRYRLYEIDRIISRTLGYAGLTGALAVVYVVAFVAVQALLVPLTSSGGSLAVAASTLAVFALFQPLRRRIQNVVDRRFNRSRYDAAREIESFAARVRDEVEIDRLTVALATTLDRTMQPAAASIWLRSGAHGGHV